MRACQDQVGDPPNKAPPGGSDPGCSSCRNGCVCLPVDTSVPRCGALHHRQVEAEELSRHGRRAPPSPPGRPTSRSRGTPDTGAFAALGNESRGWSAAIARRSTSQRPWRSGVNGDHGVAVQGEPSVLTPTSCCPSNAWRPVEVGSSRPAWRCAPVRRRGS